MTPHIEDLRTDEQVAAEEKWAVGQYGNVSVRFTEGVKGRTKRRYLVSVDGGPERNLPSVTTICDKHLPKDLTYWYEQESFKAAGAIIEDVLSHIGGDAQELENTTLDALRTFQRLAKEGKMHGAAYAMGLTPSQIRDEAGLDGNVLHTATENWFKYGEVPDLTLVAPEKRGKMQSLAAFLSDIRPRLIASEPPIYSSLYGYTGRPDLLAETDHHIKALIQVSQDKSDVREGWLPPGVCLFDFKSGNKLWTNHGIQLGMYEQGLNECNFPEIDWRIGVHLRDDGYVLHAFPDSRSAVPHIMALYNTFKSLNLQKPRLNKSLLIEPTTEEMAAA